MMMVMKIINHLYIALNIVCAAVYLSKEEYATASIFAVIGAGFAVYVAYLWRNKQ